MVRPDADCGAVAQRRSQGRGGGSHGDEFVLAGSALKCNFFSRNPGDAGTPPTAEANKMASFPPDIGDRTRRNLTTVSISSGFGSGLCGLG